MEKTKFEWVRLFNRWVDLAMTLEESGCETDYSCSLYSGGGDYVSLSFKYGDVEIDKSYGKEVTQDQIDAVEKALEKAKEDVKEMIAKKIRSYEDSINEYDLAIDKCNLLLNELDNK